MPRHKQRPTAAQIDPPDLPIELPIGRLPEDGLADRMIYAEQTITDQRLQDQQARSIGFNELVLTKVTISQSKLPFASLRDVRFINCDLTALDFQSATLNRVEFIGCQLLGLGLSESRLQHVLFKDCQCRYMRCLSSTMHCVRFEQCNLAESSFQDSDLSGAVFSKSDLRDADLQNATLTATDLCGSNLEGMRVGIRELQGAIVEPGQVIHFASLLGLKVKWE